VCLQVRLLYLRTPSGVKEIKAVKPVLREHCVSLPIQVPLNEKTAAALACGPPCVYERAVNSRQVNLHKPKIVKAARHGLLRIDIAMLAQAWKAVKGKFSTSYKAKKMRPADAKRDFTSI